jgi:2-polyprenyl-3-methyl-5-hydroxy-6-metoxy-1,4-benzoquinol methylase
MSTSDGLDDMLATNKRQKEFYNATGSKRKKNLPSRMWSFFRNGLLASYRRNFNISERVYALHKSWLGDLSDKKVLDLGCLSGNALSVYLATHAKSYTGIDLSETGIAKLKQKLEKAGCTTARAVAVDFLSDAFSETDFDVIYAYGVLHHFENLEVLIERLNNKLATGGKVIAYDPLNTSFPVRVLRALYRPFQSDKDWEWPFDKKTISRLYSHFTVLEAKGVLGKSKYGIPLSILPLNKKFKNRVIQKWIDQDWNISREKEIHQCMHVTMLMQKK